MLILNQSILFPCKCLRKIQHSLKRRCITLLRFNNKHKNLKHLGGEGAAG